MPEIKNFEIFNSLLKSARDRDFFQRVWAKPNSVYGQRLEALGLKNFDNILDAGCGLGQWSMALASMNKHVVGIDPGQERVAVCKEVAKQLLVSNAEFHCTSIDNYDSKGVLYDGIFSYSVIFFTDYKATLKKFHSMLKPGGLMYFNANGIGWYFYNLIETHNDSSDFSSRQMAMETFVNTINYYASGKQDFSKQLIMSREIVLEELKKIGFEIIDSAPDGHIGFQEIKKELQFYEPAKYGYENVWECLCRKK